jgi:hypothetical protein
MLIRRSACALPAVTLLLSCGGSALPPPRAPATEAPAFAAAPHDAEFDAARDTSKVRPGPVRNTTDSASADVPSSSMDSTEDEKTYERKGAGGPRPRSSDTGAAGAEPPPKPAQRSLHFEGHVTQRANGRVVLVDARGNTVSVPEEQVQVDGDAISLQRASSRSIATAATAACGGRRTSCIGYVEFCCGQALPGIVGLCRGPLHGCN